MITDKSGICRQKHIITELLIESKELIAIFQKSINTINKKRAG